MINKDLGNEERGNWMIEYVDEDAKEIGEALKTLILKCTNNKSYELDCTITFGKLALDCHFNFKKHEE